LQGVVFVYVEASVLCSVGLFVADFVVFFVTLRVDRAIARSLAEAVVAKERPVRQGEVSFIWVDWDSLGSAVFGSSWGDATTLIHTEESEPLD